MIYCFVRYFGIISSWLFFLTEIIMVTEKRSSDTSNAEDPFQILKQNSDLCSLIDLAFYRNISSVEHCTVLDNGKSQTRAACCL